MDELGDQERVRSKIDSEFRADVYGVIGDEAEVDSDVNEDRNREQQLDESFQDWVRKNLRI
jgi:hypothetical protein